MIEVICEQIKNWKFNHVHQTSDLGECLFSYHSLDHEINDIVFANLFTACSRKRTSYIVDRVHSQRLASVLYSWPAPKSEDEEKKTK